MGGILIGVLNDLNVKTDLINEVTQHWESLRYDIVSE